MELTLKPRIAGILIIVTGSIGILGMLILAFLLWAVSEGMAVGFGNPSNVPLGIILVLGADCCHSRYSCGGWRRQRLETAPLGSGFGRFDLCLPVF